MNLTLHAPTKVVTKDLIRVETVLTRYPIHRLAKRGNVEIEIREKNKDGEIMFRWEVDYSRKRGQPGPLAYKVDTLIINRRIDEAERPLPGIIKLGSLHEICFELGKLNTRDTSKIKTALMQNVGAVITSKQTYRGNDGSEHTVEFSNTRYGIAFTGEKLPNGKEADAVYIVLNDWYRDILDTAQTRPLDYNYLKELPPAAQRLYELLSFKMYGAQKHERPRAKLLYSDFCTYAPQTRYPDFEHVKKQMYKLTLPHKKSGYITAVHFQETTDKSGQPDWEMYYTPGLKAKGEHLAAKSKPRASGPKQQHLPLPKTEEKKSPPSVDSTPTKSITEEQEDFVHKLLGYGMSEIEARKLATTRLIACRLKIPAIPHLSEGQGKQNRAGNVRAFIERDDWQLPPAYLEAQAKAQEVRHGQEKRGAIEACSLCDASGRRFVITDKYPCGAMKPCSHNPQIESGYPSAG